MTRLIATGTMKRATAGSLRQHAQKVIADHPTMGLHTHLRDAARVLERGNTDGAIRHLNAAIGQLTPQSLQRHGVLTDEGHTAAKRHMDTIHRHILLIKDIEDAQASNDRVHAAVAARNQASAEAVNLRRIARQRERAAGDLPDSNAPQSQGGPPPDPAEGANVPVSKSQQAIPRAQLSSAGPGRPTGAGLSNQIDLVGPKGYIHGWIKVGEGGFASGLQPGSFEHLAAIEDLGRKAAEGAGDPAHQSPEMRTALHNLARSLAQRDMTSARIHLDSAKWANKHEAGGLYTRDLAELEAQMKRVPSGATGFRERAYNPVSARSQHPGRYVGVRQVPGDPTRGAMKLPDYAIASAGGPDQVSRQLDLSAQTARLAVTPAPRGRPGGPGLYDVKDLQHTPYFQQVVKALIEKRGMDPGKAYAVAYGALRKWRRGGGHVHPEVQAAATGALAGEAAKGAAARAMHGHSNWDSVLKAIELATVLEMYNPAGNPGQPRNPPGPGGGQFTKGSPPAQKSGKQPPGRKPASGKPGGNAAQRAAQKKALLAKAAVIRGQIRALQAMLHSSKKNVAKSPAAAAAAAKKAASTSATAARKPGSSTAARKKPGKKLTQAQIRGKIAALTTQLHQVLAAAAKL